MALNLLKMIKPKPYSPSWSRSFSTISDIYVQAKNMRVRKAARVLVLDPQNRVLLFEYNHEANDALKDKGSYFTVPGGGVKPNESYTECAQRELREETGLTIPVGTVRATRQAPLLMPSGEIVLAAEQYYNVEVDSDTAFDTSEWTAQEQKNIANLHWCAPEDLHSIVNLWPKTLPEMLVSEYLDIRSEREQIGSTVIHVDYDE